MTGIKKDRPEAATSRRSVQGLAPENNSRIIISHFPGNASLQKRQGGGVSAMTGLGLIFVVLGVCTATRGLARVIDLIEGR